ncbi:hypothetical protein D3C81_569770 [compost metagenome]
MPERITAVPLDEEYDRLLKAAARRKGIDPGQMAAELIQKELKKRTAPKATRGSVLPFRRQP